jgi:hypothetical protein
MTPQRQPSKDIAKNLSKRGICGTNPVFGVKGKVGQVWELELPLKDGKH